MVLFKRALKLMMQVNWLVIIWDFTQIDGEREKIRPLKRFAFSNYSCLPCFIGELLSFFLTFVFWQLTTYRLRALFGPASNVLNCLFKAKDLKLALLTHCSREIIHLTFENVVISNVLWFSLPKKDLFIDWLCD